ncbi:MAG: hypothetical protein ACKOPQ_07445 [Novosphingobium sp.]
MDSPFYFEGTTYWSEGDERVHFEWLSRISCVNEVRGVGERIYIDVDLGNVSADDFRELQAVYRRYDGDADQLNGVKPQ